MPDGEEDEGGAEDQRQHVAEGGEGEGHGGESPPGCPGGHGRAATPKPPGGRRASAPPPPAGRSSSPSDSTREAMLGPRTKSRPGPPSLREEARRGGAEPLRAAPAPRSHPRPLRPGAPRAPRSGSLRSSEPVPPPAAPCPASAHPFPAGGGEPSTCCWRRSELRAAGLAAALPSPPFAPALACEARGWLATAMEAAGGASPQGVCVCGGGPVTCKAVSSVTTACF